MFWFSTIEKYNALVHVMHFLVREKSKACFVLFFLTDSVCRGRIILRFGFSIMIVTKFNIPECFSKLKF